jgi:outer membrane immunogenic protein
VIGGVQLGYNYQFAGSWLIGVEGDFSWSGIDGEHSGFSTIPPFTAGGAAPRFNDSHSNVNWLATATARLGYAVDNWLFYAKGGAAWGDFEANSQTTNPTAGTTIATVSGGETRSGWTVGGGIEWAFLKNWSAKVEYDYLNFGTDRVNRNVTFAAVAIPNPLVRDVKTNIQTIKFGVNYLFNWPAVH